MSKKRKAKLIKRMSLKGAQYPKVINKELGIVMFRDGSKYKIVYDLCQRLLKDGKFGFIKIGRLVKCLP